MEVTFCTDHIVVSTGYGEIHVSYKDVEEALHLNRLAHMASCGEVGLLSGKDLAVEIALKRAEGEDEQT